MRRLRPPAGVLLPILLIGLVAVLATLQFRWLGKVSEAEREQLSRSLAQRAREFADEFDGEIGRVYRACQMTDDQVRQRGWKSLAAAVERWRAGSRVPGLVRALYLAEPGPDGHVLRPFDPDRQGFDDRPLASWPPHLDPVRRRVWDLPDSGRADVTTAVPPRAPGTRPATTFIAAAVGPIQIEIPALVVPVAAPLPIGVSNLPPASTTRAAVGPDVTTITGAIVWLQQQRTFVIVDLDAEYIRKSVLPALIERHFPSHGGAGVRVAVLPPSGPAVYTRDLPADRPVDLDRADHVTPFFRLRLELTHDAFAGPDTNTVARDPGGANSRGGAVTTATAVEHRMSIVRLSAGTSSSPDGDSLVRVFRPGWQLALWHGAGSLDAAVSQARRRNLALSFGILAVLAIGVTLVFTNARRSQQLAARQMHFVAAVSHELRTPLAVIRSAAQNLAAGVVADAERARRYGALIDDEGRRLTDMVEQVLDYAGLEGTARARARRPVDLAAIASRVIADLEAAGDTADVVVELDTENGGHPIPAVNGDSEALRRALQNLMINAVKHGGDGRWVGVAVRGHPADAPREIVIEVRDRGRGIDPADLGHIFEPFYRGRGAIDRQVRGYGLGLSLVKRIVETHGGHVTARSSPDEGAAFLVGLPVAPPPAPGDSSASHRRDATDVAA